MVFFGEFVMSKKLQIEVTDKNAVYVNGTRITDRSTKWGVHHTVFTITTYSKNVTKILNIHGFTNLLLDKDYMNAMELK
jgi:aspartokinase